MTKVCVITYLYGDYDRLNDIEQSVDADYYCFTDNILLKSNTWNIVYEPYKNLVKYFLKKYSLNENKVLQISIAKYANFYIDKKYDYYVKVDANVQLINEKLLEECILKLQQYDAEILYSKHPFGSFSKDIELSKKMKVYKNNKFDKIEEEFGVFSETKKNLDNLHIWNGFSVMSYECYEKFNLDEIVYYYYDKYSNDSLTSRPQGQILEFLYILEKNMKFILIPNIREDNKNTHVCEHLKRRI